MEAIRKDVDKISNELMEREKDKHELETMVHKTETSIRNETSRYEEKE